MPLSAGRWKANVNGTEGELVIDGVPNPQGSFSGQILGKVFKALWDEASQTITITVALGGHVDYPMIAVYKGYLFRTPPNPDPGRDVVATLAGFVQINDGNGFPTAVGTARRNVFGWFAQISEVN